LYGAAVALWHETGLTRPWNDPDADLRRAVEGPSSTVLAALDDGRLAGTVMVGHDGHRGWVYYLAVATTAQRSGVGTALMRAAEAWLEVRDIPALNLMVRAGNDAALAFYAALGYEVFDGPTLGRRLDGGRRGRESETRE
jgi:ribosomal protein S18 acetylase RimI-like enzyme